VLIDATIAAMFQKNFPAAKDLARKAAQLDPSHFFPVMVEGWADIEAGKFNEAVAPIRKATTMGAPPFVTAYLAYTHGAAGDRASAPCSIQSARSRGSRRS